jgi:hypothetical protein
VVCLVACAFGQAPSLPVFTVALSSSTFEGEGHVTEVNVLQSFTAGLAVADLAVAAVPESSSGGTLATMRLLWNGSNSSSSSSIADCSALVAVDLSAVTNGAVAFALASRSFESVVAGLSGVMESVVSPSGTSLVQVAARATVDAAAGPALLGALSLDATTAELDNNTRTVGLQTAPLVSEWQNLVDAQPVFFANGSSAGPLSERLAGALANRTHLVCVGGADLAAQPPAAAFAFSSQSNVLSLLTRMCCVPGSSLVGGWMVTNYAWRDGALTLSGQLVAAPMVLDSDPALPLRRGFVWREPASTSVTVVALPVPSIRAWADFFDVDPAAALHCPLEGYAYVLALFEGVQLSDFLCLPANATDPVAASWRSLSGSVDGDGDSGTVFLIVAGSLGSVGVLYNASYRVGQASPVLVERAISLQQPTARVVAVVQDPDAIDVALMLAVEPRDSYLATVFRAAYGGYTATVSTAEPYSEVVQSAALLGIAGDVVHAAIATQTSGSQLFTALRLSYIHMCPRFNTSSSGTSTTAASGTSGGSTPAELDDPVWAIVLVSILGFIAILLVAFGCMFLLLLVAYLIFRLEKRSLYASLQ